MQRTPPEGLCFELPVFDPLDLSFLSLTSFFLPPLQVNQIGTVTESIKAHNMAKEQGWGTMVSHRYLLQIQIPEDGKQKGIQILALSGLVRLRIASLLTLSSDLEPVRSRLVLPAGSFCLKTIQYYHSLIQFFNKMLVYPKTRPNWAR